MANEISIEIEKIEQALKFKEVGEWEKAGDCYVDIAIYYILYDYEKSKDFFAMAYLTYENIKDPDRRVG